MAGIGLVLSVAKDALLTHQYAMDVVSHNIANVSTDGFSRQTAVIESKTPGPYGGFIFGRGAELQDIKRQVDTFVETSLRGRTSDHTAMKEMETYLSVLEGVFDENSGRSINSQFDAFWGAWHDLSNNPSGSAERTVVFESGALLSQSFQDIRNDLDQFDQEINLSLDAGVQEINQMTSQIATLNQQIISLEITGRANDLRDQRDTLIRGLAEYIDINVFEDNEGHFTVTTGRGYTLVSKTDNYELSFESGEVRWEGSSGSVNITDTIAGGKTGGWLGVRDEIIPKYKSEFDELAETVIWEVNKLHGNGVGLEGMNSATGTYDGADTGASIEASGLDFADKVQNGQFTLWVYEPDGTVRASADVTIGDVTSDTLEDVRTQLDGLGGVTAAFTTDNRLQLTIGGGATFAFSDDSSGVLAALGINTFFSGNDAQSIAMNEALNANKDLIAAGRVDGSGSFYAGDNSNALDLAALRDTAVEMDRYAYDGGSSSGSDTLQGYYSYLVGSVGIKSASVRREMEYNEVVVNQLTQKRDNLSAVSLDEEMTNLIKYQHAYAAAAKLVSTADEMLQTLLATR
ncbi:MAG: flagellar hook-associated protein FlgK [Deltaproteobacteria bacterium]|nr:flagellar hook-associated protein FlgK [Deltaproteobacteria bacterium]